MSMQVTLHLYPEDTPTVTQFDDFVSLRIRQGSATSTDGITIFVKTLADIERLEAWIGEARTAVTTMRNELVNTAWDQLGPHLADVDAERASNVLACAADEVHAGEDVDTAVRRALEVLNRNDEPEPAGAEATVAS
jgi:hypothetical protein